MEFVLQNFFSESGIAPRTRKTPFFLPFFCSAAGTPHPSKQTENPLGVLSRSRPTRRFFFFMGQRANANWLGSPPPRRKPGADPGLFLKSEDLRASGFLRASTRTFSLCSPLTPRPWFLCSGSPPFRLRFSLCPPSLPARTQAVFFQFFGCRLLFLFFSFIPQIISRVDLSHHRKCSSFFFLHSCSDQSFSFLRDFRRFMDGSQYKAVGRVMDSTVPPWL